MRPQARAIKAKKYPAVSPALREEVKVEIIRSVTTEKEKEDRKLKMKASFLENTVLPALLTPAGGGAGKRLGVSCDSMGEGKSWDAAGKTASVG